MQTKSEKKPHLFLKGEVFFCLKGLGRPLWLNEDGVHNDKDNNNNFWYCITLHNSNSFY